MKYNYIQKSAQKCIQSDIYLHNGHICIITAQVRMQNTSSTPETSFLPPCQSSPSQGNHCCEFYHHRLVLLGFELYISRITQYALVKVDPDIQHYVVRSIQKFCVPWVYSFSFCYSFPLYEYAIVYLDIWSSLWPS